MRRELGSCSDRRPERDRLIEDHLPLVRAIARRQRGRGEPLEDLVQVGALALVRAAERYDADRGVPFAAYAIPVVSGEIRRHIRDRGATIRVPRREQEAGARLLSVSLGAVAERPSLAAEEELYRCEERTVLGDAVRRLSARERALLGLRFGADLSQDEIAGVLHISQSQASRGLAAALRKLRTSLAETGTGRQAA